MINMVGAEGVVTRGQKNLGIGLLEPATGFEGAICVSMVECISVANVNIPQYFPVHLRPAGNCTQQLASVNQVIFVVVKPLKVIVVDFEFQVWGDPRRLDGGEVDAFDGGFGVRIGHVPDSINIRYSMRSER